VRVIRALPLLGFALLLLGCPEKPQPDGGTPPTCDVVAPEACGNAALRFDDVKPLFETHCVPCHYGQLGGPWPMKSYMDVADWHDIVRDDLVNCSMPPEDAGTTMTTAERALILDWLRCGFPE
jgi:hypothetical protein